jgi:predicted nucleic acid-binding protein
LFLDSSALIAYHSPVEPTHPLVKHLLARVERDTDVLQACYSVLSATELLVRPIRAGVSEFAFMHSFLTDFPNLRGLPVDLAVATQAATIRATTDLKLPDAIIVATALLAGCEVIVSNDERWKRRLSPLYRQFTWLYLADYL